MSDELLPVLNFLQGKADYYKEYYQTYKNESDNVRAVVLSAIVEEIKLKKHLGIHPKLRKANK